jgi:hypothetical protein
VKPAASKKTPGNAGKSPVANATLAPSTPKAPATALPLELIRQAIEEESDETGWAHLGAIGSYLTKIRPDFDSRLYGFRKLSELFKKNPALFLVEERSTSGGISKSVYVKAVA